MPRPRVRSVRICQNTALRDFTFSPNITSAMNGASKTLPSTHGVSSSDTALPAGPASKSVRSRNLFSESGLSASRSGLLQSESMWSKEGLFNVLVATCHNRVAADARTEVLVMAGKKESMA